VRVTAPSPPVPAPSDEAAEALARSIVQCFSDAVTVYDEDWRIRFHNDAAGAMFVSTGRPHSLVGKSLFEEYPDIVGTAFDREMRCAMRTREPRTFSEMRPASGRWAEVHCHPLPTGGLVVIWRDVTEQRRAERTLRYLARASDALSESLDYESTIKALADLLVPELADWCSISVLEGNAIRIMAVAHPDPAKVQMVLDLDARYPADPQGISRTATVIRTGQSELIADITDEMVDRSMPDPEHRRAFRQLNFASVITVPLRHGDRVSGAMSLVATRDSGRRFTEADIALAEELARRAAIAVEHAHLYHQAIEARQSAELANDAKVAFLARMSHELRTPLNAIGGYADLMLLGLRGALTARQTEDLVRIRRNQDHLLALINDILNYARVEAGRLSYQIDNVRVADAIASIEQIFAPQLQSHNLTCALDAGSGNLVARADADRLQQILVNLVSNAMKFTPAGGHIAVNCRESGEHIELLVSDNGVGIPDDKLESIFEPFVQLAQPGKVLQGTGLGLAISRDLARAMDGDLRVESSERGSVFLLRLPRAPAGSP
jgi:signal transduction histidine kinase